jgi:hypothetical protein
VVDVSWGREELSGKMFLIFRFDNVIHKGFVKWSSNFLTKFLFRGVGI